MCVKIVPANRFKTCNLCLQYFRIINIENIHLGFFGRLISIYPDNHFLTEINTGLTPGSGFLNT